MKKSLMYCCMFICAAGILAGCSKDDNEKKSDLVGKWNVNAKAPMDMVWEAPDDVVISVGEMKLPVKGLLGMIKPKLNGLVMSGLKDVSFTADGKIEATYKGKSSTDWMSAKDYATYKVESNNKLMLYLDADKVFAGMEGGDPAKMAAIKLLLKSGIPVYYTTTGSSARFYLDTETIKAMRNFLPLLLASMKDIPDYVKPILATELPKLLEKSTKIEIGLNMTKAAN